MGFVTAAPGTSTAFSRIQGPWVLLHDQVEVGRTRTVTNWSGQHTHHISVTVKVKKHRGETQINQLFLGSKQRGPSPGRVPRLMASATCRGRRSSWGLIRTERFTPVILKGIHGQSSWEPLVVTGRVGAGGGDKTVWKNNLKDDRAGSVGMVLNIAPGQEP